MPKSDKTISVVCPLCGKEHQYAPVIGEPPIVIAIRAEEPSREGYRRIFTCPEKVEPFEAEVRGETGKNGEALSPHNRALYDTGAGLLKESAATSRDYCKALIAASFGAIPIYLSLVKLFLKDDQVIGEISTEWWVPIILFVVAAGIFSVGYLPSLRKISLDLPDKIRRMNNCVVIRRFVASIAGLAALIAAIILATREILSLLSR
jgi:hypothetical protein